MIPCLICGEPIGEVGNTSFCPKHSTSLAEPSGSARHPKVKGWWEEYRCGCVSETTARKKDLLGYCGTHGENRRQVFQELETMKAPNTKLNNL